MTEGGPFIQREIAKPGEATRLPPGEVEIVVEDQKGERFRVRGSTSQIEHLGELLRGKSKNVNIRTVLASVAATLGTILFTATIGATFQYVSWLDTVRQQNATDRAMKAAETYEKAAAAIISRSYKSTVYLSAIQEGNDKSKKQTAVKGDDDDKQKASVAYADEIGNWNEGYDNLLTNIDYSLDRPILRFAEIPVRNPVSSKQTNRIDCTNSLDEQMDAVGMDHRSLKGQFAVINFCFVHASSQFEALRTGAVLDQKTKANPRILLSAMDSMFNEFRCYALRRTEFYYGLKELAILSPGSVYRHFFHKPKQMAQEEFTDADQQCAVH